MPHVRLLACLAAAPVLLALVVPVGGDGAGADRSPLALLRVAASDTGAALGLSAAVGLPLLALAMAVWLVAVLAPTRRILPAVLAIAGLAGLVLAVVAAPELTRGPAAALLAVGLVLTAARAAVPIPAPRSLS